MAMSFFTLGAGQATEESLRKVFSQYGMVVDVKIPRFEDSDRMRGFAFVQMATAAACEQVCTHACVWPGDQCVFVFVLGVFCFWDVVTLVSFSSCSIFVREIVSERDG